ncbi:NAD(P)-binding protein [Patellaria atrata CBS 101060]|uniref:NAD(P)-binding protein n=1 Tax=Patellaria atrata CBS 101060 TaxID=1346257 RepID=A0A9P4VLE2_9PEZI|nr:NAD(P)-binding protein [Patellaria atrata CBS 101060]
MASIKASDLFSVNGMVAAITGGGTGVGLLMTRALASNGASKVYIIGRRSEPLHAAAAEFPSVVIPVVGDVTSKDSLNSIVQQIESDAGFVNLLVANSGIAGPKPQLSSTNPSIQEFRKAALEMDMEHFTHTFHLNVTAVLFTAFAFLELLDKGNGKGNMGTGHQAVRSQVITTSSIAGFSRQKGASMAYNTSKAAATHVMKMLSTYMAPWKIRTNILAPGLFPSELANPLITAMDPNNTGQFDSSYIPSNRIGDDQDMAGAILYLASRAGAFCNGNVVVFDGGRLSLMPSTY